MGHTTTDISEITILTIWGSTFTLIRIFTTVHGSRVRPVVMENLDIMKELFAKVSGNMTFSMGMERSIGLMELFLGGISTVGKRIKADLSGRIIVIMRVSSEGISLRGKEYFVGKTGGGIEGSGSTT